MPLIFFDLANPTERVCLDRACAHKFRLLRAEPTLARADGCAPIIDGTKHDQNNGYEKIPVQCSERTARPEKLA
jgi:hypothetical protein